MSKKEKAFTGKKEGSVVTFYKAGEEKPFLTVDTKTLPKDIQEKLAAYGLYTKAVRATAGYKTPDEAFSELKSAVSVLKAGKWNEARKVGSKESKRDVLVTTLKTIPVDLRAKVISVMEKAGQLRSLTADEIKALKAGKNV